MGLHEAHAPEELREPFLSAVRTQNKEALFRLWDDNPDRLWGDFSRQLSPEDLTWMGYRHQEWLNKRLP